MKAFLLTLLFFVSVCYSQAQCLIQHIPLSQRVEKASLIVEGEVISKSSFLSGGRIYTVNRVQVYKQFKGVDALDQLVNVFTWGGQVGDRMEMADPSLQFDVNDKGVFMLSNWQNLSVDNAQKVSGFWGISGPSSFLSYNVHSQEVFDHGVSMGDLKSEFYKEFSALCGLSNPKNGSSELSFPLAATLKRALTSFSPTTITAGNQKILTISGTGFGATQGTVTFANSDDGGKTVVEIKDDEYFTKWSDTEIKVYVPNSAGTGKVGVITSNSTSYQSSTNLTVTYALLELSNTPPGETYNKLYTPVLDNDNGNGGLTWTFNEDFFKNKAAVTAFLRATENWRCATLVNFTVDTVKTTKVDTIGRDGVHTVMWQNPNQSINSGALGVTFSQWSGCYNSNTKDWHWFLNDVDMVFDDALSGGKTWNFSTKKPTSGQYDFESVALHELGHAHQLTHIIDVTGVMHYSIKNGEMKRTLKAGVDISAGDEIMTKSTAETGCTNSAVKMIAIKQSECKLLNVVRPVSSYTLSADKVCGSDTIIFINTSTETATPSWSASGNAKVLEIFETTDTVAVIAKNAGKYNVKLVVEMGGYYDSTETEVTFLLAAEILGAKVTNVKCFGAADGEVSMLVSGAKPLMIDWKDNNTTNPRKGMAPGKYEVKLTGSNGCIGQASYEITEPTELTATTGGTNTWGDLAKGSAWVSVSGGTPPYKVKWSDANGTKTDTVKNLPQGIYLATVTDSNGCEIKPNYQVGKEPVGVNGIGNGGISVYPNPFSQGFSVQNESAHLASIVVFDALGKRVSTFNLASGKKEFLNLTQLPSGVYTFQVITAGHHYSQSIIKN